MRYWIGFYGPWPEGLPKTHPPLPEVLGYWPTGLRREDNMVAIAALVQAGKADEAKGVIRKHWPATEQWRFFAPVDDDWRPNERLPDWLGSPFPIPGWSPLVKDN